MGYTPGQVLGRTVTLGTLVLGQVDAAGVAWVVGKDGLRGWDGAPVRSQYSDRAQDHGSWAGPTYLAARPITISGTVTAPDLATLDDAQDQLSEAASLTDTLLVVGESVPKQAIVRRSGEVLWRPETDRIASYSLMLTAADPRRYDTVLQSASTGLPVSTGGLTLPITLPVTITAGSASGVLTLTNAGSIGTRPAFTLLGPAPTPTVLTQYQDGTSDALLYSDSLQAGDVLVIDVDARTATLNGSTSRRRYLSGTWPEIPPRQSVQVQWTAAAYDPAAALTATCRSAWM